MVFFDEYDVKISFDKSVVPLKWFSSKPIISNFKINIPLVCRWDYSQVLFRRLTSNRILLIIFY